MAGQPVDFRLIFLPCRATSVVTRNRKAVRVKNPEKSDRAKPNPEALDMLAKLMAAKRAREQGSKKPQSPPASSEKASPQSPKD